MRQNDQSVQETELNLLFCLYMIFHFHTPTEKTPQS